MMSWRWVSTHLGNILHCVSKSYIYLSEMIDEVFQADYGTIKVLEEVISIEGGKQNVIH